MGEGHRVTVTSAAATAIRRIAGEQDFPADQLSLLVEKEQGGPPKLDLIDDVTLRASPDYLSGTSNGVIVLVPKRAATDIGVLVVDYEPEGLGFTLNGPKYPRGVASDPGGIELSEEKLLALAPALRGAPKEKIAQVAWHLKKGDSRAAFVIAVQPTMVVVAAYTDELDTAALLRFPESVAQGLHVGSKLVTVNLYERGTDVVPDLVPGEGHTREYRNFIPVIADFLAADPARVAERRRGIGDEEWRRAVKRGKQAMDRARGRYRDGRPPHTGTPAY